MSANPTISIVPSQKVWSDIPTPPRRELLWIQEGKICHWCKRPTRLCDEVSDDQATIEHIIPRYKGGTNDPSNLASSCRLCNNRRSYEDSRNMKEGALLGKWPLSKRARTLHRTSKNVTLTGNDKKAIMGKKSAEDVIREQRDQGLETIKKLRAEVDYWKERSSKAEEEFKSMTILKLLRKRLSTWIAP